MHFLGIFFKTKTHHIDSVKNDCLLKIKTVLEKCILKLSNQIPKVRKSFLMENIVYFLLSYYNTTITVAKFISTKQRSQVVGTVITG